MDDEDTSHIFDALFVFLRYLLLNWVVPIGFRASRRWTRKMPVTYLKHCLYFSDIWCYAGWSQLFNHIALRKIKIAYNFGLSECKRVKRWGRCLSHTNVFDAFLFFRYLMLSKVILIGFKVFGKWTRKVWTKNPWRKYKVEYLSHKGSFMPAADHAFTFFFSFFFFGKNEPWHVISNNVVFWQV